MKKKYVKPMVVIEDFRLCESIALDCELKANQYKDACAYYDSESEMTLFASTLGACLDTAQDSEEFCYHTYDETYNIFTS